MDGAAKDETQSLASSSSSSTSSASSSSSSASSTTRNEGATKREKKHKLSAREKQLRGKGKAPKPVSEFAQKAFHTQRKPNRVEHHCETEPEYDRVRKYCLSKGLNAFRTGVRTLVAEHTVASLYCATRKWFKKDYCRLRQSKKAAAEMVLFIPPNLARGLTDGYYAIGKQWGLTVRDRTLGDGSVECTFVQGVPKMCCFHLQGKCTAGHRCVNSHVDDGVSECSYGRRCILKHYLRGGGVETPFRGPRAGRGGRGPQGGIGLQDTRRRGRSMTPERDRSRGDPRYDPRSDSRRDPRKDSRSDPYRQRSRDRDGDRNRDSRVDDRRTSDGDRRRDDRRLPAERSPRHNSDATILPSSSKRGTSSDVATVLPPPVLPSPARIPVPPRETPPVVPPPPTTAPPPPRVSAFPEALAQYTAIVGSQDGLPPGWVAYWMAENAHHILANHATRTAIVATTDAVHGLEGALKHQLGAALVRRVT